MMKIVEKRASRPQDPPPPPDGGTAAWIQAMLGWFTAFNTWGFITSFGAFEDYYVNNLLKGNNASDIAWIGSFELFCIFAVGTFSGRALDAGYFHPTYISGCVLLILGVFMTSLARNYWEVFLAQAVCSGVGTGLMFTPTIGLVGSYFSKKRIFIMAFYLTGAGAGGMVFPAVASQLINPIGFPWTVRVIGFIMLATTIPTILLYRTRLPPRRSGPIIEWSAFKEPTYTLYIFGMFFNFFPLYYAFYYIGNYATDIIGLNYQQSINLVIAINGIGMIGRVLFAWIATAYLGFLNCNIIVVFGSAILTYCWAAIHNVAGIYVFAIVYGLTAAGVQGLWPGSLAALTEDVTKVGTRMGMGFSICSISLLTGPPIGGALVTRDNGDYLYSQMWAGSMLLVGTIILLAARILKTGWVFWVKI